MVLLRPHRPEKLEPLLNPPSPRLNGGGIYIMKVINPTDNKISMQYKGTIYEIAPGSAAVLPDEVATHWQTNVHQFVRLEAETTNAPRGSEENPMTREEIVAELGEEKVAEIEATAEVIPAPEKKPKKK